jgi:hypothetical protein
VVLVTGFTLIFLLTYWDLDECAIPLIQLLLYWLLLLRLSRKLRAVRLRRAPVGEASQSWPGRTFGA